MIPGTEKVLGLGDFYSRALRKKAYVTQVRDMSRCDVLVLQRESETQACDSALYLGFTPPLPCFSVL
jgi:hypothetical protein